MSYSDLRGKTYIITGAASGMGRTTSLLLAKQGANVALLDLRKPDHVLKEVKALGTGAGEALALTCDVQDPVAVDAAVRQAKEHFGGLHGAANMAGLVGNQGIKGKGHAIAVLPDSDWDLIMNVNLNGVKNCLRAELSALEDGGSIVNAGSIAGQLGWAFLAPYCVSKAGVMSLTKIAAQESGGRGIRVNAIAPGVVRTPMTLDLGNEQELYDAMGSRTALKRLADPEEVSRVILFLLSAEASYITGTTINVDAGYQ